MLDQLAAPDLIRQADLLLGTRQFNEAVTLYTQALAIDPDKPAAWFNLGWGLRALRRFDEAFIAYGEAIDRGLERSEDARINRAVILSEHLFQSDAAIAELRRALEDAPESVTARLALAQIYEDVGDSDAARGAYQRVFGSMPGNGRAAARLGMLAIAEGDAADAVRLLTAALDRAANLADRAEILFALGDAFDWLRRYVDAFHAYEAGNTIARSLARWRYDPAAHERWIDRMIAVPVPVVAAAFEPAIGTPTPIFICGMFRSGSTLAERILARHSLIAAGGELEMIPSIVAGLSDYPENVPILAQAQLAHWREAYLHSLPAGRFVTDKRCDNVLHLGLVARLFPGAAVVHTRRIPLDNLLSVFCLHFGEGVTYGNDLREAAHYYIQYRRLMRHWQDAGIGGYDLDYDELVRDPEPTIARLLQSLGLPWENSVMAADTELSPVRTASAWQVRKALHSRSSGRWRHYERELLEPRRMLAAAGF
jgi:tetratricopeptide (TPR) repeat protein